MASSLPSPAKTLDSNQNNTINDLTQLAKSFVEGKRPKEMTPDEGSYFIKVLIIKHPGIPNWYSTCM